MAVSFYGPNATKAETMQQIYKDLAITKEGHFDVEFPTVGAGSAQDLAKGYEEVRVKLLTIFRNGLKALNASDNKSILREFYPTPGMPAIFFDDWDLMQVMNNANALLNPHDPYFPMAVTDGEIGAIRILGDVINMTNKYADARTSFVLLRMLVRPVKEDGVERHLYEMPFDDRKKVLLRRRNSVLATNFRADNNFLIPQLYRKFADPEDQKLLSSVVNAYDQNAQRIQLNELQHARWLFVLLNGLNLWKDTTMGAEMRSSLSNLVVDFGSAVKPDEIAIKIDAFLDVFIKPLEEEKRKEEEQKNQTA
ncbi:hypothetical protein KBD59_02555 [Candidatus Gracilibacteria bacterium]|nr:hypothetical protein [Candidatus Gracilibacteria bacterium]